MEYDAIVAGAGIWGCTIARRLAEAGAKVLVLEKRNRIGGNCACEIDPETGIEVHIYGSHIFHTADEAVWGFITRFTDFNSYRHMVLANYRGRIYHLPIGKTLYREFGTDDRKAIFDAFIRGYTAKQWGMPAEQVDPAIIARLKVRDSDSTDYFDDPHQGIPADGYNAMFGRMLAHANITVRCGNAFDLACAPAGVPVWYSGPIDALFGYRHGCLGWRTLRFETETVPVADYQHNTVVNYTEAEIPYTRIHEFKHYHPEDPRTLGCDRSVIMREYSAAWQPGDEPYYPIDCEESRALLEKYRGELARLNDTRGRARIVCGGRLGGYRYFDMDKSVAAALALDLGD